jgi:hypothetical protein
MKKSILIIAVGLVFGALDLIPLIPVGAPLMNMIAIVVFWLVAALMMAKTRFVKNNLIDGLILAVLLMMPLILTVTAVNPKDFFPMLMMAVVLGPLCAFTLGKLKLRD